jgi:RNA polymerase sigma factor (sigma-70 family)
VSLRTPNYIRYHMALQGRLRDCDRREVRDVYRRTVTGVYAFFCYSVDADTADDLTAATFERVVRAWSRYDPSRARVDVWVLAIARNVLRDHYRRQAHRLAPSIDEHPALAAHVAAKDGGIEKWIAGDAFVSWLSALRPREREVLALRYGADLSTDEIARCLDLTPANVLQTASRALRRLRRYARDTEPNVSGSASQAGERIPAGI